MLPFIIPATPPAAVRPISLHPQNSHYFLFRGKAAVLIGSTEHYGAVLNGAFDYRRYLDELKANGLNLTRTFSGCYREVPGNFNIRQNTLAPEAAEFVAPWPRTDTPGALDGLGKFDLSRWNDAYFRRMHDFVREAGRRGVVVEMVLFCPFYEEAMWRVSPMNAANNVNGIGRSERNEVYALKHADLTATQEALTRKLVQELRPYENVYFEICNEPYFGGVTLEWQRRIAAVITEADSARARGQGSHLIAQNIANGSARVADPNPAVSILNFHYASPPNAVGENYALKRAISFDETGFAGSDDATYRTQAWEFLLAGGAAFDHLDYSFAVSSPAGELPVAPPTPGGGGRALRKQLAILKRFVEKLDFIHMQPEAGPFRDLPNGVRVHALAKPGQQYAAYFTGGKMETVTADLPAGEYEAEWVSPLTGVVARHEAVQGGSPVRLMLPPYTRDVALRIYRIIEE